MAPPPDSLPESMIMGSIMWALLAICSDWFQEGKKFSFRNGKGTSINSPLKVSGAAARLTRWRRYPGGLYLFLPMASTFTFCRYDALLSRFSSFSMRLAMCLPRLKMMLKISLIQRTIQHMLYTVAYSSIMEMEERMLWCLRKNSTWNHSSIPTTENYRCPISSKAIPALVPGTRGGGGGGGGAGGGGGGGGGAGGGGGGGDGSGLGHFGTLEKHLKNLGSNSSRRLAATNF